MTRIDIIKQLQSIIEDKKHFVDKDNPNDTFKKDIEALEEAILYVNNFEGIQRHFISKDKIKAKIRIYKYFSNKIIKDKNKINSEEAFNKLTTYTRVIWLLQELLEWEE